MHRVSLKIHNAMKAHSKIKIKMAKYSTRYEEKCQMPKVGQSKDDFLEDVDISNCWKKLVAHSI